MSWRDVQDRLPAKWRTALKEVSAFVIVGGLCFLLDIGLFQLLYAHFGMGAVSSRLISTVVSVTVSYYAHRFWSFSHRARTGAKRESTVFVAVNAFTLMLSLGVVWLVRYPLGQESALVLQAANMGSIVVGTLVRFFSYRQWVFVAHDNPAAVDPRLQEQTALDRAA